MSYELKRLIEGFEEEKDEALQEQGHDDSWEQIYGAKQNNLILQALLVGTTVVRERLCGVVQIGSVRGFIPQEFSGTKDAHEFKAQVGSPVAFKIVTYDREEDTFIASRQAALEHMANVTWSQLELGRNIRAVVRSVERKILRADIGGIEVELPVQEYAHGWIDDLEEVVQRGDHIRVKVVALDKEAKTVQVSKKALEPDPWPECSRHFARGGDYVGKVTGIVDYGVFVNLAPGVDALTRHPKFERDKVKRGEKVLVRLMNVDAAKKQIYGIISKKL